jgi:hypothetical protein
LERRQIRKGESCRRFIRHDEARESEIISCPCQ